MNNLEESAMSFTEEEIAYLRTQRLARIATVSADGQPDAMPVGTSSLGRISTSAA